SQILMLLKSNMLPIKNLVKQYYQRCAPIIAYPLMKTALDSLPQTIGGPDTADVQGSCLRMFENSSQRLIVHQSMAIEEYYLGITGLNMRWEVIGNILILAAVTLLDIPDTRQLDSDQSQDSSGLCLLGKLLSAADRCKKLCSKEDGNELTICFYYNYCILATLRHDDSGVNLCPLENVSDANQHLVRELWSNVSDLATVIYSGGYNLDPKDGSPLFLRQLRRRCFAATFFVDKTVATFLKRPPLIQSRYCDLTPPFDFDEDEMAKDDFFIGPTAQPVDQNGWAMDRGKLRPITFIRFRFILAIIREQALEVVLTIDKQNLAEQAAFVFPLGYMNISNFLLVAFYRKQRPHGMLAQLPCITARLYGT
ncbi:hypothetical protein EYZ11_007983, partial [Aspergillus tanneri]